MNKLFEKLKELNESSLRRQVRKGMIKNYERNLQGEIILEQWIIKKILDGHKERREELSKKQAQIKETGEFINYLKKLKI